MAIKAQGGQTMSKDMDVNPGQFMQTGSSQSCRSNEAVLAQPVPNTLLFGRKQLKTARSNSSSVRVAIYSDEPILATGLKSLIAADPELKLTACCNTISQLKRQLASGIPDIAVVDFTEEITAETLIEIQNLSASCKVILWTNSIEGDDALRALRFGVRGVLRKTLPLEAHRLCLHRVNNGDLWFERQMTDSVN